MASKLNRREKTLLYLLLCLAITAGTVCLLILPAVSRNAEMRDALDAAETQKMEMEIRRNTLERTLARIEELEKEGDALYEGLFVEGIPSELYDAYLTSLALDLGITPTSLVINPVSAKTPAAYLPEEASPSASSDAKMAVRTFQIGGTASYDLFAALVAAYDAQPQLHISSAAFSRGRGQAPDEFVISLDVYMLEFRLESPAGETQA